MIDRRLAVGVFAACRRQLFDPGLVKNRGIALSREKLLNEVWGYDYYGDSRTVDVHVKRLREKLELAGENVNWQLKTVWGVGYKFEVL